MMSYPTCVFTCLICTISDGSGRSETLCALAVSLQSYKAEQAVSVFQTIKKMCIQKPSVVQSVVSPNFMYIDTITIQLAIYCVDSTW